MTQSHLLDCRENLRARLDTELSMDSERDPPDHAFFPMLQHFDPESTPQEDLNREVLILPQQIVAYRASSTLFPFEEWVEASTSLKVIEEFGYSY